MLSEESEEDLDERFRQRNQDASPKRHVTPDAIK